MTTLIEYNQSILTTLNTHKNNYNDILYNDVNSLNSFFVDINQIVPSSSIDFTIKSFFIQIQPVPIDTFIGFPILKGNSANCKFQIADVLYNNGLRLKLFYKVVDYDTQTTRGQDLLIYDVISGHIIEYIKNYHTNYYQGRDYFTYHNINYINLKDRFPTYLGESLSYYGEDSGGQYWDFNVIDYKKYNSPYGYNHIIQRRPTIYNKKCIIVSYNAIDHMSLDTVFIKYKNNKNATNLNNAILALFDLPYLMNTIKYLGLVLGFIHNDLHGGNIIFNNETKKLMIIDLGRVSFRKYTDTQIPEVDNAVTYQTYKLGYNDIYRTMNFRNYKDLYENRQLFSHKLSEKAPGKESYYGFLYDMITLSLHSYTKSLFVLKNANPQLMNLIEPYLQGIISLDYSSDLDNLINYIFNIGTVNTYYELFTNFNSAKNFISTLNTTNNIAPSDVDNIKILFDEIANGLLITALFLHVEQRGFNNHEPIRINSTNIDYRCPIWVSLPIGRPTSTLRQLYDVIAQLYALPNYKAELDKIDYIYFMMNYMSQFGGKSISINKSSTRMLKKYSDDKKVLKNNSVYIPDGKSSDISSKLKVTKSLKHIPFNISDVIKIIVEKRKQSSLKELGIILDQYVDTFNIKDKLSYKHDMKK